MGASSAERQRRSRAHRKGDHSLCDPSRCHGDPITTAGDVTPSQSTPPSLGARGARLWRDSARLDLSPAQLVLLEEACRIADRLDRLDATLRGDGETWMQIRSLNEDGSIVGVVIDKPLAEARQHATALKQIVGELRQGVSESPPAEGSVLDELAARRQDRLSNATGG